jgi:hypothetical protein
MSGPKPLEQLTSADVGLLLESVELGRYAATFRHLPVTGAMLAGATDQKLKECGMNIAFHREALLIRIAEWKKTRIMIPRGANRSFATSSSTSDALFSRYSPTGTDMTREEFNHMLRDLQPKRHCTHGQYQINRCCTSRPRVEPQYSSNYYVPTTRPVPTNYGCTAAPRISTQTSWSLSPQSIPYAW